MAHPLCASRPTPRWATLQEIAIALRNRGITGDLLVTFLAVAPAEGEKHDDWDEGVHKLNVFSIGDCAITSALWGPSIGVLQVRSINTGRSELASEPWRDQRELLSGLDAQAAAVKAIYDARGLGQWSGYSSGNYRDFLPMARDVAANLGDTNVTPDQSEIGPTGPSPTGSLIIGGRTIQPSEIRISGKDVLADLTGTRISLDRNLDEADRLTVSTVDPHRTLLRHPVLNEKATITLDGVVFEYTDQVKNGSELTLTFTDAAAVDLNRPNTQQLTQDEGTATRGDFLRRILSLVPWVQADIEPGLTLLEGLEMQPDETPWQALGRIAREVEWRRCAVANRVLIGSDAWLAGRAEPIEVREWHGGVDEIDLQSDFGVPADTATIHCHAGLWAAPPSTAVRLADMGPGNGDWSVVRFQRPDTTSTAAVVSITRPRPALDEPKPPPEAERSPIATGLDIDGPELTVDVPEPGEIAVGAVSSRGYQWPLEGRISSRFRTAERPNHQGIDIAVPVGTGIHAAKEGLVESVGLVGGYGLLIVVRHPDVNGRRYQTYYAHCNSAQCRPGQIVERGQQIAISGGARGHQNAGNSRGPHLHFEVRVNGTPQDPMGYLP